MRDTKKQRLKEKQCYKERAVISQGKKTHRNKDLTFLKAVLSWVRGKQVMMPSQFDLGQTEHPDLEELALETSYSGVILEPEPRMIDK